MAQATAWVRRLTPIRNALGCHVVGGRAVEIVQAVSIAMAARMRVDDLARILLSFPTYAGILGRAAYRATEQLDIDVGVEPTGW